MEQKKDIVATYHEAYIESEPARQVFDDICDGTSAIREKASVYLPQFPLEHADDYKARVASATVLNVTKKTVDTMCGLALAGGVKLGEDVPASFSAIIENVDNQGNHLDVFARNAFEESFDGWACIVVDSPNTTAGDLGERQAKGLKPYWRLYEAEDVINWDYAINPTNKAMELCLLVLRECESVPAGKFLRSKQIRYRAFFLTNGVVSWELYEEVKNEKKETEYILIDNGMYGPKITSIPAAFIGEPGDEPPLIDLAYMNVKHVQKTSDYDTIIHKTCVPIPYTTGIDAAEFGKVTQVGSSMFHLPDVACKMGFAEVSGNSIEKARQDLQDIEGQMATLGLSMLASTHRPKGDVTATEKLLETVKELSGLQSRQQQLKDAIELALQYTARFANEKQGGSVTLADLSKQTLSPQDIQILSTMVADGTLSLQSFLFTLEKNELLPEDVDAAKELERIKGEERDLTPVLNARRMPNESSQTQETPVPADGQPGGGGQVGG